MYSLCDHLQTTSVHLRHLINKFDESVIHVLDKHAPLTVTTKPNRSKPKWYSTSVVEAKRVRRRAERKWHFY